MMLRPALALVLVLAACGPTDPAERPAAESGPWPRLVPLPGLLAQGQAVTIAPEDAAATDARGAALRAKADRLRRQQPPA